MNRLKMLAALALACAPITAASAQTARRPDDTQVWTTLQTFGPVSGRLLVWGEVQSRFTSDVSRLGTLILRPAIGLRFKHNIDLYAGYQYEHVNLIPGVRTDEHRFWQQVVAPIVRNKDGLALVARVRLEQRMLENRPDTGWRVRGQLRLALPLNGPGTAGPLFFSETFATLNDTSWGPPAGFDQQRTFAGVIVPINRRINLEAGYMNRFVNRPSGDQMQHIANVTLFIRPGR